MPGDDRYAGATAIRAKPVGSMARANAHCRTPQDVQSAIRAARNEVDRHRNAGEHIRSPNEHITG